MSSQTKTTTFRLSYLRSGTDGSKRVTFSNVMSGAYTSWFDYTRIVSFFAWRPSYIEVSASGELTLRENHHLPVAVQAFVCASSSRRQLRSSSASPPATYAFASPADRKYLWANLKASYEDVDVGISSARRPDAEEIDSMARQWLGMGRESTRQTYLYGNQ